MFWEQEAAQHFSLTPHLHYYVQIDWFPEAFNDGIQQSWIKKASHNIQNKSHVVLLQQNMFLPLSWESEIVS